MLYSVAVFQKISTQKVESNKNIRFSAQDIFSITINIRYAIEISIEFFLCFKHWLDWVFRPKPTGFHKNVQWRLAIIIAKQLILLSMFFWCFKTLAIYGWQFAIVVRIGNSFYESRFFFFFSFWEFF